MLRSEVQREKLFVIKRGTIKSYDPAAHKADVQIAGSLAVWLDNVCVATDIPAADVIAGRQCSVLFLDPSNQDDAVVITIQGALPSEGGGGSSTFLGLTDTPDAYSDQALKIVRVNTGASALEFATAAGGSSHAPIGAVYPGVLSTGVKTPQVPFKGDAFTATGLYARVTIAPQGQAITLQIRRNGTSLGTVTIAAGERTGATAISQLVSDGNYFDINITGTGTSPNQGSDLVWLVVP